MLTTFALISRTGSRKIKIPLFFSVLNDGSLRSKPIRMAFAERNVIYVGSHMDAFRMHFVQNFILHAHKSKVFLELFRPVQHLKPAFSRRCISISIKGHFRCYRAAVAPTSKKRWLFRKVAIWMHCAVWKGPPDYIWRGDF